MPNSKQRITKRAHRKREERMKRTRIQSLMKARVGSTLRSLDASGQLPVCVKEKRLPNG